MVNNRIAKYALFSRDFKGVPNGWHNLRACNFLVGENSTGKSSFIQLIELVDSRLHMLFFDILNVVEGIESKFDVCSRMSGSSEVTIGFLIKEREQEGKESKVRGRLITYKVSDDQLNISKMTIADDKFILRMRRRRNRISYRVDGIIYNDDLSHVNNAERLTYLHDETNVRFSDSLDVDWTGQPEKWSWLDALNSIIRAEKEKYPIRMISYAPLSCLTHGPMRIKPQRLHHGLKTQFSSVGEHTPYMLRDILSDNPKLAESINEFGRISGLFDEIVVSTIKTQVRDKPFVLQVKKAERFFYVDELGYGVGQILPIIADISIYKRGTSFLVQQPELHLHPRAQAALGDVFFNSSKAESCLVVETHSDFIIDRFRMAQKKSEEKIRAQIIYFDKSSDGKNISHEVDIDENGAFVNAPENFREFFLKESIDKFELL